MSMHIACTGYSSDQRNKKSQKNNDESMKFKKYVFFERFKYEKDIFNY